MPRLSPHDLDVVPVLSASKEVIPVEEMASGHVLTLTYEGLHVRASLTDEQLSILRLVDERRTTIIRATGGDQRVYRDASATLYRVLNNMEAMQL